MDEMLKLRQLITKLREELNDAKARLDILEACPYMKSLRELGWQPVVEEPTGTNISQLTDVPRPDLEIEPTGVEKSQSTEDRINILEDDRIGQDTWRKHCLRLTDSQLRVNALIRELRNVGIITAEMLIRIDYQHWKSEGTGLDFSRLDETKIAKKESREDPKTGTKVDEPEIVHVLDLIFRCRCDKVPVLMLVPVGHGEMLWVCPDCNEEYGRWKPPWLREPYDDRRPSESAYSRAMSLGEEQSERFIFHMPKEDMSVMERYHGEEWTLVAHEHGIDMLCNDRECVIAFYSKEPELGPCDCDPCIGQSLGVDCEKCLQIIQSVRSKPMFVPSESPEEGSWLGNSLFDIERLAKVAQDAVSGEDWVEEHLVAYRKMVIAILKELASLSRAEWKKSVVEGETVEIEWHCTRCGYNPGDDLAPQCPNCGALVGPQPDIERLAEVAYESDGCISASAIPWVDEVEEGKEKYRRIIRAILKDIAITMKGSWSVNYCNGKRFGLRCSRCGNVSLINSGFCPNCGADMREISAEEPKKGEWIIGQTGGYNCSICDYGQMSNSGSVCPKCGADMRDISAHQHRWYRNHCNSNIERCECGVSRETIPKGPEKGDE